jgi:hypothetical protein
MKKLLILILAVYLAFSVTATGSESSLAVIVNPPSIQVHGAEINAPAPFVKDGVTWVPFRAVAEAYNYRVEWDADTQTVIYINYHGWTSFLAIDGVNAVIVDGRTFVPYDFFAGLNFDDNNIISRLGYSKEFVSAMLKEREIFRKHFTEPHETWLLSTITRGLPYPIDRRYWRSDAQTEPVKSISIEYEYEEENNPYPGGNGLNPFYETINENNALILFALVEDLEQVNFLHYFDGELNRTDSYTLADLTERFGKLNPLDMGVTELHEALSANFQISEWYFAHYERIYLGEKLDGVSYRNGEPDEIINQADGSLIWTYVELGKAYKILTTGEREITNPGVTVQYYFNSPSAKQNDNLTGLYATKFSVNDGESYLELTAYLGFPAVIKDMGNGYKYIAYPLREGQRRHAYFILQNNIIIAEGVMYGDDYTILNLDFYKD